MSQNALYGGETRKAIENFPISGEPVPISVIHWLARIKGAAAAVNGELGLLRPALARRIEKAAAAVAGGAHDDQFPLDVFQTGSGTSTNMNVNEVIANRAIELAGGDRFDAKKSIHPNDHVNMGQSTNDMFPTTIHVAVAVAIKERFIPALKECHAALAAKAKEWE